MPAAAPYTGLSPTRVALPNGVVVLAKETSMTPAVTISLAVRSGSADTAGAPGAMSLLSRLLDRGTAHRSGDRIAEELDSRGISLNVVVTRHHVTIVATCLAEDFDEIFALVGDVVMAPTFPAHELVTRKGEALTAIRQEADNPYACAADRLMAELYPGHPYGRPARGTLASVEPLARDQLVALHRARFAPDRVTVAIVGDIAPARAIAAASRVFDDWHAAAEPDAPLPPAVPATVRRRIAVVMADKPQADIAYGFVTIARRDPAYTAAWLMNHAFGQYSIGGRLGDSIRERQGMAYYVSSALDPSVVQGPLMIRAGVDPANVDRAIASIDEEIARLVRDGLSQKELDDSRQYLVGALPRALETNPRIAHFLQDVEFFGHGLDYDVRLPELLGAVTLDDANEAARRLLDPSRATVVVAGNVVRS